MLLAGCGASDDAAGDKPETFVFTAIPDQDEQHLRERFGQVADYLSKELDVPVRYVPVKSYAAAVTAFANDQVQLAWFGGLSGVQSGAYQAGALNFQVWQLAKKRGLIDTDKVKVIWQTPPYPDYHWTIRGDANDT